jgi:hypothetical protein
MVDETFDITPPNQKLPPDLVGWDFTSANTHPERWYLDSQ